MFPHTTKPADSDKHKLLDREIREMVSTILLKAGGGGGAATGSDSTHHFDQDDDNHGVRIITLAGTNAGATMRGEVDDKPSRRGGAHEALIAYVNSNIQAVNNSIMMSGSYTTNDPGVQMDISDFVEQQAHRKQDGRKGKKKENESSKSDNHVHHSD